MPLEVNLHLKDGSTAGMTRKQCYIAIDEALCAYYGVDPDPIEWYRHWANIVPVVLAFGLERPAQELYQWFIDNVDVDAFFSRH